MGVMIQGSVSQNKKIKSNDHSGVGSNNILILCKCYYGDPQSVRAQANECH